ncbi:ubiquitinyl hydrolase 1 [Coemansia sp. RSA 922]|nr:ubiquitinyl hydrolase 1 [Coemansia sp. S3946]KAJ2060939.1 ubiquitinyl hydrolase 1 [Coemansia sp. S155-1]KAJ2106653.1 ubiquitinyl hydrolase 1 [Coemansia sp. RSA 922]
MSQSNSTAGVRSGKIQWVPLESSPEAMNRVIYRLGVEDSVGFSDVLGLDEELLTMVAQPVNALVFLFPLTDKFEEDRKQEATSSSNSVSPKVWFMQQTIGNACGTMAIFHAMANNQQNLPISGEMAAFFERTKDMTPEERAANLEKDNAVAEAHKEGAAEGQTAAPKPGEDVNHHYAAFACIDGHLYELDGRLPAPINHGPSVDALKDGARVIRQRIQSFADDSLAFSVISLGPSCDDDDY